MFHIDIGNEPRRQGKMVTKIIETVEWNMGCLMYRAKHFVFGDAKPPRATDIAAAFLLSVVGFQVMALLFV